MGNADSSADRPDEPYDDTLEAPISDTLTQRDEPPSIVVRGEELRAWPVVPYDHYDVGDEFARGGIGRILRARDRRLDRVVAIKELKKVTRYTQLRFAREVRISARLQHPSIIPVHEAGRWPSGEPFFAMKLVDGGSLEDAIDHADGLQERLPLVRHVAAVADAMAYSHTRHTVHRDLKPSNVLLGPFGETVVIDWGLAKDLSDPEADELPPTASEDDFAERLETKDGVVLGTPPYMAPEQAKGLPVDERGDVYAIGAVLYNLISGRVPYHEYHPREILKQVIIHSPTPLEQLEPDVPPDLLAIVVKAMAREPEDRYANASALAAELHAFLDGGLVGAYEYSTRELVERFVARQRSAVLTGLIGLLALAVGGVWSFANINEEKNRAEAARGKAEKLAELEGRARQEALQQLDRSILEGARSAVDVDPTHALALLKTLRQPIAGAATIAADAAERGIARHVLTGHGDRVDALAISPDGKTVVSAGSDETVRLWFLDGRAVRTLEEHASRVAALAFSPDGKILASAGYDAAVLLHERETGKLTQRLEGHEAPIRGLAWAPNGEHLVSVAEDGIRRWDAAEGRSRVRDIPSDRRLFARYAPSGDHVLTGSHEGAALLWNESLEGDPVRLEHGQEVKAAAFSPDGTRILTGAGDLRVWGLDGSEQQRIAGAVEAVAWLPDGSAFVSGTLDGAVRLHAPDGDEVLTRHQERITAIVVSNDGQRIAAASWDKSCSVHDRRTGVTRMLKGHRDVVTALAFAGDTLATTSWDRTVRLWPLRASEAPRRTLMAHPVGAKAVAFSPDGKQLASGGHDDRVRLWDAESGALTKTFLGHEDHVFRVRFSPDGRWIASSSDDRTVRLWRAAGEGEQSGEDQAFGGHQADVEELVFSPDSKLLVSAGEDDVVGLWDVEEGSGRLLPGHGGAVTAVAFAPKGDRFASGSRDGSVRLWDRDGNAIRTLGSEAQDVTGLAYSPTGDALAAASEDGLRLWPMPEGEPRLLRGSERARIVAFSPKGDLVAVATNDATIAICAVAGDPCRALRGHGSTIHALTFTSDGQGLVSGSGDGTIRLWDVDSGESRPLRGHAAPVFDVALSPDDRRIASASGDTTVRLWPLDKPPTRDELAPWLAAATTYTVTP